MNKRCAFLMIVALILASGCSNDSILSSPTGVAGTWVVGPGVDLLVPRTSCTPVPRFNQSSIWNFGAAGCPFADRLDIVVTGDEFTISERQATCAGVTYYSKGTGSASGSALAGDLISGSINASGDRYETTQPFTGTVDVSEIRLESRLLQVQDDLTGYAGECTTARAVVLLTRATGS